MDGELLGRLVIEVSQYTFTNLIARRNQGSTPAFTVTPKECVACHDIQLLLYLVIYRRINHIANMVVDLEHLQIVIGCKWCSQANRPSAGLSSEAETMM